jgi:branched-chain amino acid transport system ATP-binding protein
VAEILRLDGVTAGYGGTVILDDVSLAVPEGGALAVLGRNGVGKTTLIRTIIGQTRLHGGDLRFVGRSIAAEPCHRRAALGMGLVPQGRQVFASLTVEENLRVAARPGPWSLARVLKMFPNLADRRRHRANRLSGGEQQMLAIGRALVGNPRLLLLDEPMEGLAPVVVEHLFAVLRVLRDEGSLSILLVEQYARAALEYASRCVVLERGRVAYDGDSAALAGDATRLLALLGASR